MKILLRLLLCFCFVPQVSAQLGSEELPRTMNEGTLIGVGSSHVKDTYLSPFNYSGWGARILNERMKIIGSGNGNFSRQQIINVDISFTKNPAENVNDFGAFVDYSLGYHYRINASPNFKILTGTTAHLLGGFIYNTRNGNNPLSAKIDIDLGLSVIMLWNFRMKNTPLTLRYQGELPFAGVFFSPEYGVSYYEMFNVGNLSDVVAFNSFHNKFALKNYVTLDIPMRSFTLRLGYLNSLYYTDTKDLSSHIISNSFMVGWVKEFIPLGGKRKKYNGNVRSSYY
ncbi:hypothetical protein M2459_003021 [Parabacteroides sp. PF5-5]|uniref:DUF3316 domain-containing protein n=1 Tax=unclassified Parabacteroides TaxID=2649774 RepID=UPI0024738322|nr:MULTISPECIES: DUF3316 domain-containing protein [unclassified Parabacteroides]MDH6306010.1 hypothetical protein [Parabacteroides sp. PH5-39]MDH6317266.1 hypothetical protein [Parabacteroides sp. PF5-13]MDH6320722.1 hypothetical protein [Parabacteroides sp. PH5-13]MDH6324357.1 hypothetical protein [Parabacteroides sp. PH5-8]MDH6328451.1 hypothetical protein [Parabacteroides sp. PH5-41]